MQGLAPLEADYSIIAKKARVKRWQQEVNLIALDLQEKGFSLTLVVNNPSSPGEPIKRGISSTV